MAGVCNDGIRFFTEEGTEFLRIVLQIIRYQCSKCSCA
jgi:hypothetical protein